MKRIIVSRHPATTDLLVKHFPEAEVFSGNVTPEDVRGVEVVGNIPMHLAALTTGVWAVEFSGAPPRGTEYGQKELEEAGMRLSYYQVLKTMKPTMVLHDGLLQDDNS
jgi:hypothetical protein